jgi:hypothetical protein
VRTSEKITRGVKQDVNKMLVSGLELICPGPRADPLSHIDPLSQVGSHFTTVQCDLYLGLWNQVTDSIRKRASLDLSSVIARFIYRSEFSTRTNSFLNSS